jgi:peptide-N4-(N-acetyl-beta-glucosaminyl)asparagine amidase
MHEIRKLRRENMDKPARAQLIREDEREERELRSYVAQTLTSEMINSLPGAVSVPGGGDIVKSIEERQREMEAQQLQWRGQDSR